jgi:hypothetical protein
MKKWHFARYTGAAIVLTSMLALSASGTAFASGPQVKDAKYGFSFSLPAQWVQVPLNGSDIKGLLAQATKNDPTLENAITLQVKNAAAQGIKVFAIGPASGAFSPNLNLAVGSSKGAPTGKAFFDAIDAQEKLQLVQSGLVHVTSKVVKLHLGKVLEVTYGLPKSLASVPAWGTQIVIEHKKHIDFLTITSLTVATNSSTLGIVAQSWKWAN